MIVDKTVPIESNKKLNSEYYLLEFVEPEIAAAIKPGQFVNIDIKAPGCLLRRPFSIFDVDGDRIQILYKAVGKGTKHLTSLPVDSLIDVMGPLGTAYEMPRDESHVLLIGGGTGIASLHFLARTLLKKGAKNMYFGLGIATKELHVTLIEKNIGDKLRMYTDDGSLGQKGFVTDLLTVAKGKIPLDHIEVFACGPHAMIEALPIYAEGIEASRIQVSLEERMACGLGACLGCMCDTIEGQKTVCKDGPVFRLSELKL